MKAARQRKSVAAVIREKLTEKSAVVHPDKKHLLQRMQTLAKEIGEKSKGVNMTEELIKMRYEQ